MSTAAFAGFVAAAGVIGFKLNMYLPNSFHETDRRHVDTIIDQYGFGTWISVVDEVPFASHLPFVRAQKVNAAAHRSSEDIASPPMGDILWTHVARSNPHWKSVNGQETLVIFQGPHGYVSPTWYEAGPAVPTWNYVVVHAYGIARTVEDLAESYEILMSMVSAYEPAARAPEYKARMTDDYVSRMLAAIVAIEFSITRVECKLKLSQNRSDNDRQLVADHFQQSASTVEQDLARWMKL